MAKGNTYTCTTCGDTYTYCPTCAVTIPQYDKERFCCQRHADIFEILSKHGCGLASAEETYRNLKSYDLTNLKANIMSHINSVKPKKIEKRVQSYKAEPEVKESEQSDEE